ncbi:MAG: hypothetical protein PHN98_10020, partial [Smithellaceae bacterium]|nr:hypothetical protein [Smithellaceae bacterium]
HTAVMRIVNVTHLEACPLSAKTTGAQSTESSFMCQQMHRKPEIMMIKIFYFCLGQWIDDEINLFILPYIT